MTSEFFYLRQLILNHQMRAVSLVNEVAAVKGEVIIVGVIVIIYLESEAQLSHASFINSPYAVPRDIVPLWYLSRMCKAT